MSSEKKMISLKSRDEETFENEEAVALKSETIKHMIEDGCADNVIPLPNVSSATLSKVLEYCNNHVKEENDAEYLKALHKHYIMDIDRYRLFNLILAANYLNIKGLLDLANQTLADNLKNCTPEEVRKIFNIENDFSPEDEDKIREENKWSFEGVN